MPAQRDEPGADLADHTAVVLAEVGDRLVIRRQPADQPHHFHVAPGLSFDPERVELAGVAAMPWQYAGRRACRWYVPTRPDRAECRS